MADWPAISQAAEAELLLSPRAFRVWATYLLWADEPPTDCLQIFTIQFTTIDGQLVSQ